MPHSTRPGDVLAGRYRLVVLLDESSGARFWRAHDKVLQRNVALHVIGADDDRAAALLEAARRSALVLDPRVLRVLDAERDDDICYVVNEWGDGVSLDILVATQGPVAPRRAAWLVCQVAEGIAAAHAAGVVHGRLVPENVLVDRHGEVKIIGLCVDAAMHGRAGDRSADDVTDLAGLLYCALTARWPREGGSQVPAAPEHHGHPLRPRRVRAGIPGQLDALCDEVLRAHHHTHRAEGLGSARGIADLLADYVGDATGMAEAWRGTVPALVPQTVSTPASPLPSIPDPPAAPDPLDPTVAVPLPDLDDGDDEVDEVDGAADDGPATGSGLGPDTVPREQTAAVAPLPVDAEPEPDPEPNPEPEPTHAPELPTEAGLPIFGEEPDDVSWLTKRTAPVPPPPPFDTPPERPLFAPEPDAGEPVRKARPGAANRPDDGDFWPWDASSAGRTGGAGGSGGPDPRVLDTGTGAGLGGTGLTPVTDDEVPGRTSLRVAAAIAVALLLLVTIVVAYNLGRGRTPLGNEPTADETTGQAEPTPEPDATAVAVPDLVATDLDPQGEDGEENPDDAPLAVDGDPTTTWSTVTYEQQLGPGGLKDGVGLLVDLGEERQVSEVELTLVGSPTGVDLYLTADEPDDVEGLTPVASETAADEQLTVGLDDTPSGRYLVVWFTALPEDGDGFRGTLAEVAVQALEPSAAGGRR